MFTFKVILRLICQTINYLTDREIVMQKGTYEEFLTHVVSEDIEALKKLANLKELIAEYMRVNKENNPLPLFASLPKDIKCLELLLQNGLDPNMRDDNGKTPLMLITQHWPAPHFNKGVELLLKYGANPNAVDHGKQNALTWALYDYEKFVVLLKCGVKLSHDAEQAESKESGPHLKPLLITLLTSPVRVHRKDELFQRFLECKDFDINAVDEHGQNIMFFITDEDIDYFGGRERNIDYFKPLIEAGANPNLRNKQGRTPLMSIFEVPVVELLLKAGADFTMTDREGRTALEQCIYNYPLGQIPMELIKAHARPWLKKAKEESATHKDQLYAGQTALYLAVFMQDEDLMRASCTSSSIDTRGALGNTPLLLAFILGDFDAVRFLLYQGASIMAVNSLNQNAFHVAIASGSPRVLDLLREVVNAKGQNTESISAMLSAPDAEGLTPLEYLFKGAWETINIRDNEELRAKRREAVQLLLRQGAKPQTKLLLDILNEAVICNDTEWAKSLITLIVKDVNFDRPHLAAALPSAIKYCPADFVDFLLKQGADPKMTNGEFGYNSLHILSDSFGLFPESNEKLQLLLATTKDDESGDPLLEHKNRYGNTPLNLLLKSGCSDVDVIRQFVQCGAELDSKNKMGRKPIHNVIVNYYRASASLTRWLPALEFFVVEKGVSLNEKDNEGRTPLMLAAGLRFEVSPGKYYTQNVSGLCEGEVAAVELLIRHGARVSEEDQFGKTAIHYAEESQCTAVIPLLKQKLAAEQQGKTAEQVLTQFFSTPAPVAALVREYAEGYEELHQLHQ